MLFEEEMRAAAEGYATHAKDCTCNGSHFDKAKFAAYLAGARAALKSELIREVREALGDTVEWARFNHMLAGPMKKCELALTALKRAGEGE